MVVHLMDGWIGYPMVKSLLRANGFMKMGTTAGRTVNEMRQHWFAVDVRHHDCVAAVLCRPVAFARLHGMRVHSGVAVARARAAGPLLVLARTGVGTAVPRAAERMLL
jgi:hypothetical protein